MRIAFSLACTLTLLACQSPAPKPEAPVAQIDQSQAKQLAVDRYRQLFEDKYFLNQADHQYRLMPAMSSADINHVEDRGRAWLVVAEPPAGMALEALVAKDGSWVELVRVRWAVE